METRYVPSEDGLGNAAVVPLLDPGAQAMAGAMAQQDCAAEEAARAALWAPLLPVTAAIRRYVGTDERYAAGIMEGALSILRVQGDDARVTELLAWAASEIGWTS